MAKIIGVSEICRRMLLSEATVMGLIQSGVLTPAQVKAYRIAESKYHANLIHQSN